MKKLFAVSLLALVLCSCGLTSTKVGVIALVSDVKQTDEVVQISNVNFSNGTKEGKACGKNILAIVATGDLSVETAKKNGKISNITAVTTEVKNMVIMSDVCTIVRGN